MMILQRLGLLACVAIAAANAFFRRDTGQAALDTPAGRWILLAGTIVAAALCWTLAESQGRPGRER